MTASIPTAPVRVSREAFDAAIDAALRAGWTPRPAFDAVMVLLSAEISAAAIVRMFDDCRRGDAEGFSRDLFFGLVFQRWAPPFVGPPQNAHLSRQQPSGCAAMGSGDRWTWEI